MDRDGHQEIHYRALEGDVDGISDRLAAGDDISWTDRRGFTALHFAAQQSQRKKRPVIVNVAVARELAGWCWSLATQPQ